MAGRLMRNTRKGAVAGVCAGLADYLGLTPGQVRLGYIAATMLLGFPGPLLYLLGWALLPVGDGAASAPPVQVEWQAHGLTVSWKAGTVPYTVSWWQWATWSLAILLLGAAACIASIALVMQLDVQAQWPMFVFSAVGSMVLPGGLAAALLALYPRPYRVTLTEDAVLVHRPLGGQRRIPIDALDTLVVAGNTLELCLLDGTSITLPRPRDPVGVEQLQQQVRAARQRVLAHHHDLEQAAPARERVEALLGQSQ